MTDKKRLLILASDCDSTRIVFNALRKDFHICAVVFERAVPRGEFLKKRIKRLGAQKVMGQLAFRALVVPALSLRSKARIAELAGEYSLDLSPVEARFRVDVPSVNSDECRAALRDHRPDLVVVNGTRIISRATLDSIPARFINMHTGLTPLYRGVHGGYWALAQGRRDHFGVTIHFVDTGIDTGTILKQGRGQLTDRDNFATYAYLQYALGVPLLAEAVAELLAGECTPLPTPDGVSRLWSHPTLAEYLSNLWRLRVW